MLELLPTDLSEGGRCCSLVAMDSDDDISVVLKQRRQKRCQGARSCFCHKRQRRTLCRKSGWHDSGSFFTSHHHLKFLKMFFEQCICIILVSGNLCTLTLFSDLPQAAGWLPLWQLLISVTAVFNSVQNFVTLKLTRKIYPQAAGMFIPCLMLDGL